MNKGLAIALSLAARFEGFYASPYLCPAGVPTIGYGATRYPDGRRVALTDSPVSKVQADALLRWEMEQVCVPAVHRLCPEVDNEYRLAALLDFTFNLGVGALKSSTLRRCVNAGEWDRVPDQLMRWVYGGGRRLPGLVRRRAAEASLI